MSYSQISLTDGCNGNICDANPKYGTPMTLARAVAYCESECDGRAGCTGFFFQKHNNGHEICGFYSTVIATNNMVGGGHMYGAVCLKSSPCRVTVYEHWPEGIKTGMAGLETAEQAWGGHFPTGASLVLNDTGNHQLGALNNLTSSVKVEGACCKAYGYVSTDCSGTQGNPITSATQHLSSLPAGMVTPATGLSSVWGCNDCAQCVKVTQTCP